MHRNGDAAVARFNPARRQAVILRPQQQGDAIRVRRALHRRQRFGGFIQHRGEPLHLPDIVQPRQITLQVVAVNEWQFEDRAHRHANHASPPGVGAFAAEDDGIDAERRGNAKERAQVLRVAGGGQHHQRDGAIRFARGALLHDRVDDDGRLAPAHRQYAGVELVPDDLMHQRIGHDVERDIIRHDRAELREPSLGDHDRFHGKVAGEQPFGDELALGDEAIALRRQFAVLEVAIRRDALVLQRFDHHLHGLRLASTRMFMALPFRRVTTVPVAPLRQRRHGNTPRRSRPPASRCRAAGA